MLVIGSAKNYINDMTQCILKDNGRIIPWRTVKKLTIEHLDPSNEVEKGKRYDFDKKFRSILGNSVDLPPSALEPKYSLEDDDKGVDNLGP